MRKKNQSNTMSDQLRPRSTIVLYLIDSLQNDVINGATNTMKLPTQGTTIRMGNIRTIYAFRERVVEDDNAKTLERYRQQIRLKEVVCFFLLQVLPAIEAATWLIMISVYFKTSTKHPITGESWAIHSEGGNDPFLIKVDMLCQQA